MCGIAGWLGHLTDAEIHAPRVQRAMRHRGPDGCGAQLWEGAGLVHTRLSILDPSPAGAQPITNENRTVWVVFNGEIYNHKEIRRTLENRGHRFNGHSDSEILPHMYEEEGLELVKKLRGMFAIAIYDTRSHTMLLARDRFGIKPLFYAQCKHRLVFASEIGALKQFPGIDLRPDRQAIYDFSALFHIPAPETFFVGIRALQPSEILEVRLDCEEVVSKTQRFHQWAIAPDYDITLPNAVARADELIMLAVKNQLESDVALGTLLSGGIDSSLVSAAAQMALGGGLRTFNVQFSEEEYDETWAAVAVANYIESEHQTLLMDHNGGTWEHITGLLRHAGQPFADTSVFAVNAVCRLMRSRVTVALSGDGGDEAFGGYDLYWRIKQIARGQRLPVELWSSGVALLSCLARIGLVNPRLPRRLRDLVGADNTSIIQVLCSWIRSEEHARLCRDTDALPVRRLFEPEWTYDLSKYASRLDHLSAHLTEINTRLTLPNDFLFKVDIASMKESLEIRVPMLDENLFAFAISLPHALKVSGRTGKLVLRDVARRRLPKAVAAKPKQGFEIPIDAWVDADFKGHLRDYLLDRSSKLAEFFYPHVYRPIIEAFCDDQAAPGISRASLYQRTVMLLSVQLALDTIPASETMPHAA